LTIIALVLAVAAGATLLVALGSLTTRRARSDDGLAAALAEVSARVDRLANEVGDALQAAGAERRRGQALGDLGGSIDLDEVLTRTLEAATRSPGIDAALLTVRGAGDEPVVATLGIDVDAPPSLAPPDGSRPRAVRLGYMHDRSGAYLRAALAVPLPGDGGELGYLVAYARDEQALGDAPLGELEQLVERAGPAIDNALRFREARQLAELDALTGLHNRRSFHETLAREVARAHRYQRELALLVLDLDDFKRINDRVGHLAGDTVLAEVAERLRDVVRAADVACRIGGDEFAIVLPESTLADAEGLYRRLQAAMAKRPLGQAEHLSVSAGLAELRADDDAVRFFERADRALYGAKAAGKGTLAVADDALPAAPATFPLSTRGTAGSS
jgi:diguanylate cyclase (GGDEF)-like protein